MRASAIHRSSNDVFYFSRLLCNLNVAHADSRPAHNGRSHSFLMESDMAKKAKKAKKATKKKKAKKK